MWIYLTAGCCLKQMVLSQKLHFRMIIRMEILTSKFLAHYRKCPIIRFFKLCVITER